MVESSVVNNFEEEKVTDIKQTEILDQGAKMLNGRTPDNALLDNIARKGANSYYYAHAPKDFSVEGA